jgi:hypothetical protein
MGLTGFNTRFDLSGGSIVLLKEGVKAVAALDWATARLIRWIWRSQLEPTMRTLVVVVLEEVHAAEVTFVADQYPVEAFAAHRLHESLCVRVRDGRADWGADHADAFARVSRTADGADDIARARRVDCAQATATYAAEQAPKNLPLGAITVCHLCAILRFSTGLRGAYWHSPPPCAKQQGAR